MSKATREPAKGHLGGAGEPSWLDRLMAVTQIEREFIASNPRLRREIRFQATALLLGPTALAFAIYKVAISLLGYTPLSAAALAAGAGFSLFAIDQHYLIQARGNASDAVRRSMYKVRFISILIISLSFALMTVDTFSTDIDRVLAESGQARRAELERSPRYQAEIDAARTAVTRASEAAQQAETLRARVVQLQAERARALEEMTNEIQGNTTGNNVRRAGKGPKARAAEAAAERIRLDIEATKEELARFGNVTERMAAAKQQLAMIDQRIDQEIGVAFGGKMQRLEGMVPLLQNSLSAWVTTLFWLLIGSLPDFMMIAAQRRMFSHELFAAMRAAEHEDLQAQIAQVRRELRDQHTGRLEPLYVRLEAAKPQPEAHSEDNNAAQVTRPKQVAGDRA